MSRTVELYPQFIHEEGATLDNCIAFINYTKMQMIRSGGDGANQKT